MTDKPAPVDVVDLQKQIADLKRQVVMLTAQVQAAINQRNFFANDAIATAGEYAVKGQ